MISCQDHDYIEIACLYRYPVTLTLRQGAPQSGIAVDTAYNEQRQECLVLATDCGEQLVPLDQVAVLTTSQDNPHFQSLKLTSSDE
ncbi:Rho-binding antiterminator [uncultured Ferrimonas sp.]|uniref:Rho-binding antiterminator n=1 Tax=uncultured Ferrimonas sp. TaxID=432640 RepID=UPI00262B2407|nr:Rho-binding antiterminator [uncultured Ferrimonas sp.]